jgi:hypothetical protein
MKVGWRVTEGQKKKKKKKWRNGQPGARGRCHGGRSSRGGQTRETSSMDTSILPGMIAVAKWMSWMKKQRPYEGRLVAQIDQAQCLPCA